MICGREMITAYFRQTPHHHSAQGEDEVEARGTHLALNLRADQGQDALVQGCEKRDEQTHESSVGDLEELRDRWLSEGHRPLTLADLDESLWPAGKGAIYAIRSPSGKWYIGQTRQALRERWKQHGQQSRKDCRLIAAAIAKYGAAHMELWVLEYGVALEHLNDRERARIAQHNTMVPKGRGYNLTPGGEQSPMQIPEVAARSSATHVEQWKDPEHRAKMSAARQTAAVQEHCAKMRASRPEPQYWLMPRAEALRKLKAVRLTAKQRAERAGKSFDSTKHDERVAEHEARHKEEFYAMEPAEAVRVLKRNKDSMGRWWRNKDQAFHNEWWYDDQIEAHGERVRKAARTSSRSLPSASKKKKQKYESESYESELSSEDEDD